jgi:hypothetical protein
MPFILTDLDASAHEASAIQLPFGPDNDQALMIQTPFQMRTLERSCGCIPWSLKSAGPQHQLLTL